MNSAAFTEESEEPIFSLLKSQTLENNFKSLYLLSYYKFFKPNLVLFVQNIPHRADTPFAYKEVDTFSSH